MWQDLLSILSNRGRNSSWQPWNTKLAAQQTFGCNNSDNAAVSLKLPSWALTAGLLGWFNPIRCTRQSEEKSAPGPRLVLSIFSSRLVQPSFFLIPQYKALQQPSASGDQMSDIPRGCASLPLAQSSYIILLILSEISPHACHATPNCSLSRA